jgi:CBS domain-containing protein
MVYLSELCGRPVYDSEKTLLGSLADFVFIDGEQYAEITHIVYKGRDGYKRKVAFGFVREMAEGPKKSGTQIELNLTMKEDNITTFFLKVSDLLVSDILDKQVVDVNGAKIVRVNDVILGKVGGKFCVVAVAVGKRSLLRRLGLSSIFTKKLTEHVIPWESVEALEPKLHGLHLKVQKDRVTDLHPEDIADVMEDLTHNERALIFKSLNKRKAAEALIGSEPAVQASVLQTLKLERIKDLLEDIPTDQAADIISMMSKSKSEKILQSMRPDISSKVKNILNYPPESAAAIMGTSFITVPEDYTAQQSIELLRRIAPSSESIYHIYVVDNENRLMGYLSIRKLIIAPPESKIFDIMNKEVIYVKMSTPKEEIAKAIAKYDVFVLPVVNDDNVLKGIVTADDVLTEVMPQEWRRHKYMPPRIKKKKRATSQQGKKEDEAESQRQNDRRHLEASDYS